MALRLDVQNFRCLKNVVLQDETPHGLSIVVGDNESGKSSLIGAMQFCCTGTAFGRKGKDTDALVTRGEERMTVRLQVGPHLFCRTRTTGDALKGVAERLGVPVDVLPLLFHAKMNGDGGCKAMKTFLDGVASSLFDPLIHFAEDMVIRNAVEMARRAGKVSVRQIVEYCELMRAQQKAPPAPVIPTHAKPTDEFLNSVKTGLVSATEAYQKSQVELQDSIKLGQNLSAITGHMVALETYEKQKSAANVIDRLRDKREYLIKLSNINIQSLEAVAMILTNAGLAQLAAKLMAVIREIQANVVAGKQTLVNNPPPACMPQMPQLADEAQKLLDELSAQQLNVAELLVQSASDVEACRVIEAEARLKLNEWQNANDEAQRQRGAWDAYEAALPAWEESKVKVEADWQRWDRACKEIVAAETEHANKAGDAFGEMVSEFSAYILQGRKVRISKDEGIFVGADPIDDCSESTKWRVEIAIMAAVARTMRSPILLVDGADILDEKNRSLVSQFLLERILPFFEHTVVCMTPRGKVTDEKATPAPITKWILVNGQLEKCQG